jgi:Domain of unknown function (DUF4440)
MRTRHAVIFCFVLTVFAGMHYPSEAQQVSGPQKVTNSDPNKQLLRSILEPKVKAEWEALKNKDKNAFGSLLADDFEAVEDDGDGARNKLHAVNEAERSNIYNYTMAFFDPNPLCPDAAFVTYEVTMEFPPKVAFRFKRIYVTEIWVKRGSEWKERHYQETRVK